MTSLSWRWFVGQSPWRRPTQSVSAAACSDVTAISKHHQKRLESTQQTCRASNSTNSQDAIKLATERRRMRRVCRTRGDKTSQSRGDHEGGVPDKWNNREAFSWIDVLCEMKFHYDRRMVAIGQDGSERRQEMNGNEADQREWNGLKQLLSCL